MAATGATGTRATQTRILGGDRETGTADENITSPARHGTAPGIFSHLIGIIRRTEGRII